MSDLILQAIGHHRVRCSQNLILLRKLMTCIKAFAGPDRSGGGHERVAEAEQLEVS